ncbi:MAG TPA: tetratricopeptide repeat protein [Blastocatellia bacterium]|nr:tetratricopeptide repeat protein [Blastocatellia bacterium]
MTEHIIEQLKAATKKYSDIEVQPLDQTITVQQGGSEIAYDVGMKRKASIVLWGWYAANVDAGSIHTYFEVLREPKGLSINQSIEKQTTTISELRGFKIQTKLSGEMTYLTLLTVGLARYESDDYDGAIDRFTTAINQSGVPNQMVNPADIYFYRGTAYYYKAGVNGIDNAIADYDNAIRFKPDDASAYYNRGVAYGKKGDYDRAIADYDNAIRLKPDDASAYNNRGNAYGNKGDYDRAIADYDNAIKLNHDYEDAYYNRGVAYDDKGDYDRAIADYDNAIRLKPDDASAYYNRGVAYGNKGDYDRAIADYDKAIKLNPDNANAYYSRAAVYKFKGERERAIADLNHFLQISNDSKLRQFAQEMLQELGVK